MTGRVYTIQVNINVAPEMKNDLDDMSKALGAGSVAAIVRMAVKQYLIDNAATLRRYRQSLPVRDD